MHTNTIELEQIFGLEKSREHCPTTSVKPNDVYTLNPLVRLRNEYNDIRIISWDSARFYQVNRLVGITLGLFDGKRSIKEIAEIIKPFYTSNGSLLEESPVILVGNIASYFLKKNHSGADIRNFNSDLLSKSILVSKNMLKHYNSIPRVEYRLEELLPSKALPIFYEHSQGTKLISPTKLNFRLTSKCSTNCRYCYMARRKIAPEQMLPKKRVLEILKEAYEIGTMDVMLNGGDMLLYDHLFEVLNFMTHHKFFPLRMSTKSFLSKEMAEELAKHGIIWEFQFSVDSLVDDIADWLVAKPGFCKTITESIQNAIEAGLSTTVQITVTPYNILTIPETYRKLKAMGVSEIWIVTYCRSAPKHTDDLFNHSESMSWLKREINRLRNEFPDDTIFIQNGLPQITQRSQKDIEKDWNVSRPTYCPAGRSKLMICEDGKVIPCEQVPETEDFFCGDLKKQSLIEVWNSKRLADLTTSPPKEMFKKTPCYTCKDWEECRVTHGICIRDIAMYHNSTYLPAMDCPKSDQPFIRVK